VTNLYFIPYSNIGFVIWKLFGNMFARLWHLVQRSPI